MKPFRLWPGSGDEMFSQEARVKSLLDAKRAEETAREALHLARQYEKGEKAITDAEKAWVIAVRELNFWADRDGTVDDRSRAEALSFTANRVEYPNEELELSGWSHTLDHQREILSEGDVRRRKNGASKKPAHTTKKVKHVEPVDAAETPEGEGSFESGEHNVTLSPMHAPDYRFDRRRPAPAARVEAHEEPTSYNEAKRLANAARDVYLRAVPAGDPSVAAEAASVWLGASLELMSWAATKPNAARRGGPLDKAIALRNAALEATRTSPAEIREEPGSSTATGEDHVEEGALVTFPLSRRASAGDGEAATLHVPDDEDAPLHLTEEEDPFALFGDRESDSLVFSPRREEFTGGDDEARGPYVIDEDPYELRATDSETLEPVEIIERKRNRLAALKEKLGGLKKFGQPIAEFFTGATVTAGAKFAARTLFTGTGGLAAAAGVGALSGAALAAWRRLRTEGKAYQKYKKEFFEGDTAPTDLAAVRRHYDHLIERQSRALGPKDKELISDEIRYLSVALKRMAQKSGGKKTGLSDFLNDFAALSPEVATAEGLDQEAQRNSERAKLMKAFKSANVHDRKKLLGAVGRGAIFGAIGGVVGAELVQAVDAGQFDAMGRAALNFVKEKLNIDLGAATENVRTTLGHVFSQGSPSTPGDVHEATQSAAEHATTAAPVPPSEVLAPPAEIPLTIEHGSNPWDTVKGMLEARGVHPTNAQMLELMKQVSADSHINVSEWNIQDAGGASFDEHKLPEGFELKISQSAQDMINRLTNQ